MAQTAFDTELHGFRFPNSFPGGAVIAEITRQERSHDLTGVRLPRSVRHLADITQNMAFWGSFGLCGGMSWAALDRFFTGLLAPESNSIPDPPDHLFTELVIRQLDSMRGQQMLSRCLTWQLLPDRSPWWMFWRDGVLEETGKREWPALKAWLDDGTPTSLTLIRAAGVADPSNNHQVVAIGYEEAADRTVEVKIYDPNHPGAAISLHLRFDPRGRLEESSQTSGEPLRGFFVWDYSPRI